MKFTKGNIPKEMSSEEVDKVIRIIWQTLLQIPTTQEIIGTRLMPSMKDLEDDENFICIDLTRPGDVLCGIRVYNSGIINFILAKPDSGIEYVEFSELGENFRLLPIYVQHYIHTRE